MTRRYLPFTEWARLDGTTLGKVWHSLPLDSRVLVVEDAGRIVGCWAFVSVLHAEGVYIAPEHRKGSAVARHLLRGLRETAAETNAAVVWTGSEDESVAALCRGLRATEVPYTSWVIPMVKGDS